MPTVPLDRSDLEFSETLSRVVEGTGLDEASAHEVMRQLIAGELTTVQIAGLLAALRVKGESAQELAGFSRALHESAIPISTPMETADIAGTGGDGTGAINISTMAAVVAAAAGVTVVKHGGRSASSGTAGSADFAEHLGIPLVSAPNEVLDVLDRAGIAFLFAPLFNPGLRHAVDARRGLGIPTVFNTLAPMINPSHPKYRVVGAAQSRTAELIAQALASRGSDALVVRGRDGLDKFTTTTSSDVWVVRNGQVSPSGVDPQSLGIRPATLSDLRGGSAADNAAAFYALLEGRKGAVRDVVLLNAAALVVSTSWTDAPLTAQLRDALVVCARAVDSGAASTTLQRLVEPSGSTG